jgi:hypothetical protein
VRRRDSTFRLEKKTGTSLLVSKAGMMTEVRASDRCASPNFARSRPFSGSALYIGPKSDANPSKSQRRRKLSLQWHTLNENSALYNSEKLSEVSAVLVASRIAQLKVSDLHCLLGQHILVDMDMIF